MSLYSALMASVSGMSAQANSLSTISDNIANADTTGYKQASAQFEDMLNEVSTSQYNAGGVATIVGYNIAQQGDLTPTNSSTDLAIQGNGFFVVQDASGDTFLTRAGSFTQNANGDLVNASGYTLLGYPVTSTSSSTTDDTLSQLVPVAISTAGLSANPSTSGTFIGNLPSNAAIDTGDLPSVNAADSTYTDKTSLVAYDDLGNAITFDVYFTQTGTDTWEADVYNSADAAPGGGFPYSTGPITTQTMTFDPTSGALTSSPDLTIDVPNGQTLQVDVSGVTQLAASFSVSQNVINGNAPASFQSLSVSADGTLSEVYADGSQTPIFRIPLATVASVDNLTSKAGDVFEANSNSGDIVLGTADTSGFGSINSSNLEASTVDLATELTNMVVTQSAYQANSKAFQVGSELLSDLVNLLK
jgi:flagellar hook protein FlgE